MAFASKTLFVLRHRCLTATTKGGKVSTKSGQHVAERTTHGIPIWPSEQHLGFQRKNAKENNPWGCKVGSDGHVGCKRHAKCKKRTTPGIPSMNPRCCTFQPKPHPCTCQPHDCTWYQYNTWDSRALARKLRTAQRFCNQSKLNETRRKETNVFSSSINAIILLLRLFQGMETK